MAAARGLQREEVLELAYPLEIDWGRCFREIRQLAGWTPYRVAGHLGADTSTVYSWASGSEPGHAYGAALLVLHRALCGVDYSEKLYRDARPRV